jgi:hypothetical protein
MAEGERDVLEVLKTEMALLKTGEYSLRSAWGPTCINFDPENRFPCTETLDSLYRYGEAREVEEVEESVGNWLCTTIDRLERERGDRTEEDRVVSTPATN